jgi:hypothetical protein
MYTNNPTERLFDLVKNNPDYELIKQCLDEGADPNIKNADGETPLLSVMQIDDYNTAKLLVEHGANLEAFKDSNFFYQHIKNNNYDVVELLIKAKANLNKTKDNKSPLHFAVESKNYDIAELLAKAGAETNIIDNDGRSLLHIAVYSDDYRMAKLLVEHGAKVDLADKKYVNILHQAIQSNNSDMVKLLLDAGANPNIIDQVFEETPLRQAIQSNNSDIVKLLLDKGANPYIENKLGKSALDEVIEKGDPSCIQEMLSYLNQKLSSYWSIVHKKSPIKEFKRYEVIKDIIEEIEPKKTLLLFKKLFADVEILIKQHAQQSDQIQMIDKSQGETEIGIGFKFWENEVKELGGISTDQQFGQ